jgi:hypothetical protein
MTLLATGLGVATEIATASGQGTGGFHVVGADGSPIT